MSTVLVVDDEQSILAVTSAILEKHGYRTIGAASAEDAERQLEAGGVDVVLLDVVLPGRGGIDLLMGIRQKTPSLPVIVMSGKVSTTAAHFVQLASQFGAKCVIAKPFAAQELVEAVASVLDNRCA